MNKPIIALLALTLLFSCKKEEIPKSVSGVYKENSIFPMKEGDIWRCDITTYSYSMGLSDSTRSYYTYYDTLRAPILKDGLEYYSFFYELYALLNDHTVQTSFKNNDIFGNLYPGEYVWFADVKQLDTVSTIRLYSDVGPQKAITIAYPDRVKFMGRDCKKTEIMYFNSDDGEDHFVGKKVLYFIKGTGPLYDVEYRLNSWNNNYNDPPDTLRTIERFFSKVGGVEE